MGGDRHDSEQRQLFQGIPEGNGWSCAKRVFKSGIYEEETQKKLKTTTVFNLVVCATRRLLRYV